MASFTTPELDLEVRHNGTIIEADVGGEIDLVSVPALETRLIALLDERPERMVVDLSEVAFIDSSGVHLFERLRRSAAGSPTDLTVRASGGVAPRVFTLCGREATLTTSPTAPRSTRFVTDWTL